MSHLVNWAGTNYEQQNTGKEIDFEQSFPSFREERKVLIINELRAEFGE